MSIQVVNCWLQSAGAPTPTPTVDYFAADGSTTPILGAATYPTALYDATGNKTWIVWEAWNWVDRVVRVRTYDHSSGSWGAIYDVSTDTLTSDNHGPPAICMDHEGYVHCFFGAHTSALKHAVTDSARDPSAWTQQTDIGTDLTYPHPVLVGSTMYLFARENSLESWSRRKTSSLSGGTATWGAVKYVAEFDLGRFYQGPFAVDGTDIHFVACYANSADTLRQHIYHFVYDTTDDSVKNADGSVSTAVGSQPIRNATANASYRVIAQSTNVSDIPGFCMTPDGTLHIAYIDDSGAPYDIKYVNFDGSAWSAPATLTTTTGSSSGFGFLEEISLVPRSDNSIELWYPNDDSDIWTYGGNMKRMVRSAAGTWGTVENILTAGTDGLARPAPVLNGHSSLRVIFCEDAQVTTASDNAAGGLKLYAHGDGGFVGDAGEYEYFGNVVFQATFSGTDGSASATDDSGLAAAITFVGNAQIQSNKLELDGTGDWITVPNSQAHRMREDFCDEYFGVVFDSNTTLQVLGSQYDSFTPALNQRGWAFQYRGADATDTLSLYISTNGETSGGAFRIQAAWTPTIGQPYDLAVRRHNGTLRVCIDGVMIASASDTTVSSMSSSPLAIGQGDPRASSPQNSELDGRIAAVRFHRGVDPYGDVDDYTVPTLPLPTS